MTSRRIALATYEGGHPTLKDDRLLQEELRRRGFDADLVAWSDPGVAWERFGVVVVRSTWDYHRRIAEFDRWLGRLGSLPISVSNPVPLMTWNLRKTYLRDLRDRGVRLPLTLFGEEIERSRVEDASGAKHWVVKPLVGAGAEGIRLLERRDLAAALDRGAIDAKACFVQEFIPEIRTAGEISLVFIEGRFVGAVEKTPAAGDFRVQEDHGGRFRILPHPDPALVRTAAGWIERVPGKPLYARVDGCLTRDGFVLMELELVEPELFLRLDPRLVDALASAIGRASALH